MRLISQSDFEADSNAWLRYLEVLLFSLSEIPDMKELFLAPFYFLSSKETKTASWQMMSFMWMFTFVTSHVL